MLRFIKRINGGERGKQKGKQRGRQRGRKKESLVAVLAGGDFFNPFMIWPKQYKPNHVKE
jgi:hypothetical protein